MSLVKSKRTHFDCLDIKLYRNC